MSMSNEHFIVICGDPRTKVHPWTEEAVKEAKASAKISNSVCGVWKLVALVNPPPESACTVTMIEKALY